VVFASSNHVMGGHKEEGINCNDAKMITPDTDPFPGTKADVPSKIGDHFITLAHACISACACARAI